MRGRPLLLGGAGAGAVEGMSSGLPRAVSASSSPTAVTWVCLVSPGAVEEFCFSSVPLPLPFCAALAADWAALSGVAGGA